MHPDSYKNPFDNRTSPAHRIFDQLYRINTEIRREMDGRIENLKNDPIPYGVQPVALRGDVRELQEAASAFNVAASPVPHGVDMATIAQKKSIKNGNKEGGSSPRTQEPGDGSGNHMATTTAQGKIVKKHNKKEDASLKANDQSGGFGNASYSIAT